MLIDFRERRRGGGRVGEAERERKRETSKVASHVHTPTGDHILDLGLCFGQESNPQPFVCFMGWSVNFNYATLARAQHFAFLKPTPSWAFSEWGLRKRHKQKQYQGCCICNAPSTAMAQVLKGGRDTTTPPHTHTHTPFFSWGGIEVVVRWFPFGYF